MLYTSAQESFISSYICLWASGGKKCWLFGNLHWYKTITKCYCGRCSSELAQLVPLPYSRGRSTRYFDRLHDFSVTIPRCYKNVYVDSFFPRATRLWNSLPIECFLLTYDPFLLTFQNLNGVMLFKKSYQISVSIFFQPIKTCERELCTTVIDLIS